MQFEIESQRSMLCSLPHCTEPHELHEPCAGADALHVQLEGEYAYKHFRKVEVCEHETNILRQLAPHAHIVELIHVDLANAVLCFRREPVDLMRMLLSGKRPEPTTHSLSLLSALTHCHRAGLVHRDLKPENVLLNRSGEAVLCDFGRSRFAPEPLHLPFAGTLAYAAPEALNGLCCLANDIWACGIVLFCATELLMPFEESDVDSEKPQHAYSPPINTPCVRAEPIFLDSCWNKNKFLWHLREIVSQCLRTNYSERPPIRHSHARLAKIV